MHVDITKRESNIICALRSFLFKYAKEHAVKSISVFWIFQLAFPLLPDSNMFMQLAEKKDSVPYLLITNTHQVLLLKWKNIFVQYPSQVFFKVRTAISCQEYTSIPIISLLLTSVKIALLNRSLQTALCYCKNNA
jgi:hypothetical protein